jgi:hypothetical protein
MNARFVPRFTLIKTGLRLRQRGTRVALGYAECCCSLPYTFLGAWLESIHNSPEKVDQFFWRFKATALSGHYVLRSSGETG